MDGTSRQDARVNCVMAELLGWKESKVVVPLRAQPPLGQWTVEYQITAIVFEMQSVSIAGVTTRCSCCFI
jgi:hypothetical protein